MPLKILKNKKGFTIIEALMALLILSLALVPSLGLALTSVQIANRIRHNVIATNLAQEGIEVVQNIRDRNWIRNRPFNDNLDEGEWEVEYNDTGLSNEISDPERFLRVDNQNGVIAYSGTPTIFQRRITITHPSVDEIKVLSTVTWLEKGVTRSVTLESHLFDWQP